MAEAPRKKEGSGNFAAGGRREGAWVSGVDSAKEDEADLAEKVKPRHGQGNPRAGMTSARC